MTLDQKWLEWATPRQREVFIAVESHGGNQMQAAKSLGVSRGTVRDAISGMKKKAIRQGHSPDHGMTRTAPEGFHMRGVSTLYDSEGRIRAQWVKNQKDEEAEKQQALIEAIKDIAHPFRGKSKATKAPKRADDDLLCVYPFGDPHLGMYAWAEETGADFDLAIAERNMIAAVDQLVSLAPPSKQALLINLGDFFHSDNSANTTTRGTKVDVDTRWARVLGIGVRTFRRCIDRALRKHETVHVICSIGNHDDHTSTMLTIALSMFYENNPRVKIDTSPQKFHWFRFDQNLIGVTHGDTVKLAQLPGVMAVDRKRDWGETTHRHWYTGHVHHDRLVEFPGCKVETFRTLAGRDAWHHGQGYRSGQDMKLDVWHRRYGVVNRHTVGIQQIRDLVQ